MQLKQAQLKTTLEGYVVALESYNMFEDRSRVCPEHECVTNVISASAIEHHTRAVTRQECCPCPEKRRVQSCAITSHQTVPEQRLVQSDPITSVSNFRLGRYN